MDFITPYHEALYGDAIRVQQNILLVCGSRYYSAKNITNATALPPITRYIYIYVYIYIYIYIYIYMYQLSVIKNCA